MRTIRALLGLLGLIVIAIGVAELVPALPTASDRLTFGAWFLVPAALSDAAVMPAVAIAGFLIARTGPSARLPLICGGVLSLALIAVAGPFLGTPGLRLDNPTLLNRDYVAGLLVCLAGLWFVTAGWWLVRRRPDGHARPVRH